MFPAEHMLSISVIYIGEVEKSSLSSKKQFAISVLDMHLRDRAGGEAVKSILHQPIISSTQSPLMMGLSVNCLAPQLGSN